MDYRIPVYLQIRGLILSKIENKEYLPGEMIPSERVMAETFKVNRMTVKNAINSLVADGVLFRIQGKGTFVTAEKNKRFHFNQPGSSFSAKAKGSNLIHTNKTLNFELLEGHSYFCEKLDLTHDSGVYGLSRIRYGDGAPLAIEHAFIPAHLFPDANKYNFENVSLYDYMDSKGHMPTHFDESLFLTGAYESIAKMLDVEVGASIFIFEYVGRDAGEVIVEYTKAYMCADKVVFNFIETRK